MTQPQQQQDDFGPYPVGCYGPDMFIDYVIRNNKSATLNIYYLVKFIEESNKVVWTKKPLNAKTFDSEKKAREYGDKINRPFDIEERQDLYFGGGGYF